MRFQSWIAFARAAVAALLTLAATAASAQTPTAAVNVAHEDTTKKKLVSPVNPWLSAQVAYKFPGGDASESFLVSARALYWLTNPETPGSKRGWGMPILANFTGLTASTPPDEIDRKVQEVASSAEGIWVSTMPYWRFAKTSFVSPTVFFSVMPFKANAVKTLDGGTETLYQGNASVGGELGIGEKDGRHLLTVSASATYALPYDDAAFKRAFPNDEFKHWSGEVTAVLPISNTGLGLLVEGIFPEGADPGFRAGLVISTEVPVRTAEKAP